jgi:hypothetical protein
MSKKKNIIYTILCGIASRDYFLGTIILASLVIY